MYVALKLLSGLRVSWLFWSCVPLIEPVSVELISLDEAFQFRTDTPAGLLSVDDALAKLEKLDPRQGHIVEMRFYGGLTVDETAEVLSISSRTVEREWTLARAWLYAQLKDQASGAF